MLGIQELSVTQAVQLAPAPSTKVWKLCPQVDELVSSTLVPVVE